VLTGVVGADKVVTESAAPSDRAEPAEGWIAIHAEHDQAAALNRRLAETGIYASGIETGSDLETLFLQLTADSATPGAATPADRPAPGAGTSTGPSDWGKGS
jgi:hypothetical protein